MRKISPIYLVCVILIIFAAGAEATDSCRDVLDSELMTRWEFKSVDDLNLEIRKILKYDYQQLKKIVSAKDTSFGLSIPVVQALLDLSFSNQAAGSNIEQIRERISLDENYVMSNEQSRSIRFWIAPSEAIDAWKRCMEGWPGLLLEYGGSLESNFTIYVKWKRTDTSDPKKVRVIDFNVVGAKTTDKVKIEEGKFLREFRLISQNFERTNKSAGRISISTDGHGDKRIDLPAVPPPPSPPKWERVVRNLKTRDGWASPRFVPPHVGNGDTDFHGNGPNVYVRSLLEVSQDRRHVYLALSMNAKETESDWTEARGDSPLTDAFIVYTAPDRFTVKQIIGAREDKWNFTDGGHSDNIIRPFDPKIKELKRIPILRNELGTYTANGLIKQWIVVGDLKGPESGTRTSVQVELFPISIEIEGEVRRN